MGPLLRRSTLRSYLELVRPANLATAVANVLAGYAAAGLGEPGALGWLLISTVCLYGGGVVLNDYFDRHLDWVERPERPLPSGRIAEGRAASLGVTLLGLGVFGGLRANPTAGAIAAVIAVCVVLYDAWAKHHAIVGPFTMGLCRGLNLTLGMAAVPTMLDERWPLALIPLAYIAAVTLVSRREVRGGQRGVVTVALSMVSGVVAALLLVAILVPARPSFVAACLVAVLGWRMLSALEAAWRQPQPSRIRHAVRTGILSLVLVDATIGAAYAGPLYSLAILAVGAVSLGLARLFPVT